MFGFFAFAYSTHFLVVATFSSKESSVPSKIAASYPALWSSIVVAREGNADIALCNALGSNVFNNFLGLGLPWLTYSIVYNNNPYSGIQNNGVVLAFIILNVILFAFYLVVAFNSFELNYK